MRRAPFWPLCSAAGEEAVACATAQPAIPAGEGTHQPAGPELGGRSTGGKRSIVTVKQSRPIDAGQVPTYRGAGIAARSTSLRCRSGTARRR